MKQPDNFVDAESRLAMILSNLLNGGYVRSDRDQHLANRVERLLLECKESAPYYNQYGNLKNE